MTSVSLVPSMAFRVVGVKKIRLLAIFTTEPPLAVPCPSALIEPGGRRFPLDTFAIVTSLDLN